MPAHPLTAHEREEIRAGIERQQTLTVVADLLGRHRSTISSEVRLNGGRDAYTATAAHARAAAQRCRPRLTVFESDLALTAHVEARLRMKDSPMTISIELARSTHGICAQVSHETIYQAVYAHGRRGLAAGLHAGLHRRRRCRKHRVFGPPAPAKSPLGVFNLIGLRPAEADGREVVGHFEGDLIVGSFNRSAIVTIFDRASRFNLLADLPEGHTAQATLAALVELFERVPQHLRKTLTWDQGREMAAHTDLAALVGIDVYFANPHAPWERPTNENGNGLLRRYVCKGTDLSVYTPADLLAIETRLNTMPRRSLDWHSAADRYNAAVAMTG